MNTEVSYGKIAEPEILQAPPMGELKFRRLAGLCHDCGMARAVKDTALCANCEEEVEIANMHKQWRAWGIAA